MHNGTASKCSSKCIPGKPTTYGSYQCSVSNRSNNSTRSTTTTTTTTFHTSGSCGGGVGAFSVATRIYGESVRKKDSR
jgi:hypothetical protein